MRRPFGLPRNVVLLGWTSFFTDIGSEMILPLLPVFLRSVLGAPMWAIGLTEGGAEAAANATRVISGYLSDRFRRTKPFVFAGYGLSSVVKPLLALAFNWPFVLIVRFMDRIGKGLRSAPRDAIVAGSTPRESFGKAYGFHRSMDTAGALVGSAVAAVALLKIGDAGGSGIRMLFAASALPSLVALIFISRVQEPQEAAVRDSAGDKAEPLGISRQLWLLLAGVALWEAGNLSYAFVLLRITDLGVPVRFVALLYFGYNALYMVAAMPAGLLADRMGIRTALLAAPLAGVATFAVLGMERAEWAVPAGLALFALHGAVINTVPRAAVAHYARRSMRGTVFGLVGACAFLGNFAAGAIWESAGSVKAMQFAAVLSLLALAPFALLRAPDVGRRKI
jgi:MFS family permease